MRDQQLFQRDYQRLRRRLNQTETQDTPPFEIGARVYNSANISVPSATNTALTFNSERFDTDGIHSTSSNTGRLTCTQAGTYVIAGHVEFAANATGRRVLGIRLNGTTQIGGFQMMAVTDGTATRMSVATVYELAVGDYVELTVNQTSGGALNVQASGNDSPEFAMYRLP